MTQENKEAVIESIGRLLRQTFPTVDSTGEPIDKFLDRMDAMPLKLALDRQKSND